MSYVCACGTAMSRGAKRCLACEAKRRSRLMKGHGTVTRYVNMGCRCKKCKAAWSEHQRNVRAKALSPKETP